MKNKKTVIRYEEAGALTKSIKDERLRAFVNYGLTTALLRRGITPGIDPEEDFDLHFFAEVLRAMGENPEVLLCIFQGEIADLAWWPDDG